MSANEESSQIQYINELTKDNKIVVFSKTWCPYCHKAKDLFTELREPCYEVMLDNLGDKGVKIQQALETITQQKTVPNIFINGRHVGGYTDVYMAKQCGRLDDLLKGIVRKYDHDLIIIGGGSGGLAAAQEAVALGKNVAICDFVKPSPRGTTWGLGGTCVNVGCVPKKLMHRAGLIGHDLKDAPYFGWNINVDCHDWNKLVENVQDHIKSINWNYRKDLKKQGITYYNAYAKFVDNHTLTLTDKNNDVKQITGEVFIIATGGRPNYGEIPGAEQFAITSDDLFSLPNNPGDTLVIGGGYIALESAGFLHEIGNKCVLMARSILLRGFDQTVAGKIEEQMIESGIQVLKKCIPVKISEVGRASAPGDGLLKHFQVEAKFEDGSSYVGTFNTVLLAIGRKPCTDNIGVSELGINLHKESGKIIVDENERTNVKNIFAVGDVIYGKPELTPVAIHAGKLLAKRLFSFSETKMIYRFIPTTVFTPLEYGCVGFSEEGAIECYGQDNIEVFHSAYSPLESSLGRRFDWKSYAKIVCLKEEKKLKVIGLHVLGANAGEITQGFALAIKLGATKEDFDLLVGIHPTSAQVFTKFQASKSAGEDANVMRCCS